MKNNGDRLIIRPGTCGAAGGLTKGGRPCGNTLNLGPTGRCLQHDPARAAEQRAFARAGGLAAGIARREAGGKPAVPPYTGRSILHALRAFGEFDGPSWDRWRVFLKALYALPMSEAEQATYSHHTGRGAPPERPFREAWALVGRRGGKSRIAAAVACYLAGQDYSAVLAPGERGLVMCMAADRGQAQVIFKYVTGLLRSVPELARLIVAVRRESVDLSNGVTIAVHAASFRTTRGFTLLAGLCDEAAFWRMEASANPDREILNALRPGLLTVPGSLLLGITTVYARRGVAYDAFARHHGQDTSPVLVWRGTTLEMNPSADAGTIARALDEDPAAAGAEYLAEFRGDVEGFLSLEAVQAATARGRKEIPRIEGVRYVAFTDPSGGSQDSFALAIAHTEKGTAILDVVREVRPPFSPDSVVAEFAATLRDYGIAEVVGDRYAGEWPRERFRAHGIAYKPSEATKSDLYLAFLPLVNAGRASLLDSPRLTAQLVGLERRTARSGKDSVDHAPGGRDDLANAVAGALVTAAGSRRSTAHLWRYTLDHGGLVLTPVASGPCTCWNCRHQTGGACAQGGG